MGGARKESEPWRATISRQLAWTLAAVSLASMGPIALGVEDTVTRWAFLGLVTGAAIALVASTHARIAWRARAIIVSVAFSIVGLYSLSRVGFFAGPTLALSLGFISSGILLGRRLFVVHFVVVGAIVVLLAVMMVRGVLPAPPLADIDMTQPRVWLRTASIGTLLMVTLGVVVVGVVQRLESALERERGESSERLKAEAARRDAENVAIQAQKMETLGRIAAGAAHDFNNHLTVISLHAELLAVSRDPAVQAAREGIRVSIAAASTLARQLLVLGRRETRAPRVLSLRTLVESYSATMRRVLPSDIGFAVEVEGEPWTVADEVQLHQAMLNLVINARDAVSSGGRVRVRTRVERATAPIPAVPGPVSPGEWAIVEVEDDGRGMDAATLARAAEPFFSTKGRGGTGLGLSTTSAIAAATGGSLTIASTPGAGTCVRLYLPSVESVGMQPSVVVEREASLRGRTILFAEDGGDARRLTAEALEGAGAKVLTAADGDEALAILERHGDKIDLLCTDAVMPGTPVSRLLERWAERRPGGPVVLCSGHVAEELARRGIEEGRYVLVQKPFTIAELVGAIARELDAD